MSPEIYRAIVEQLPYANFVFNLSTQKFIYFNQAFHDLLNKKNGDISLSYIQSLLPAEDQDYLKVTLKKLLENSSSQKIELQLSIVEQKKWISLNVSLFGQQQFIIGSAEDVTAEKNNLETLKKFANKKNSTLNILAHDLRGPLGNASMITQMLNKKISDPKLISLTQSASKILKQTIDMIADLIGREFLETTDVELVKKRVNISIKLKEYFEECQKSAEVTKRVFNFNTSDDFIFLNLDESKFMQVINNLMTNALKFTHDGGVISLAIAEQDKSVLFTFSDNGIGIPRQFHPTLFSKFTDARRKGLHGEPSVGLGLSIVKTIVEWHKGTIWFESDEGKGTTFFIEIPKEM